MDRKYRVVTLCGSTKFKDDFLRVQKELTLKANIVISVGLFGHSGDAEVWENRRDDTFTRTKRMLDDMHKEKIDLADAIYVINPGGYIGTSTWSEICYAKMTGKIIDSMEPISLDDINAKVNEHIELAKKLAANQSEVYNNLKDTYPSERFLLNQLSIIEHEENNIVNPWENESPFEIYGKEKMARFIEDIIMLDEAKKQNQ